MIGDCETGLVFDVQKRQTPDFVGDKQEKYMVISGKSVWKVSRQKKGHTNRRKSRPPI